MKNVQRLLLAEIEQIVLDTPKLAEIFDTFSLLILSSYLVELYNWAEKTFSTFAKKKKKKKPHHVHVLKTEISGSLE